MRRYGGFASRDSRNTGFGEEILVFRVNLLQELYRPSEAFIHRYLLEGHPAALEYRLDHPPIPVASVRSRRPGYHIRASVRDTPNQTILSVRSICVRVPTAVFPETCATSDVALGVPREWHAAEPARAQFAACILSEAL